MKKILLGLLFLPSICSASYYSFQHYKIVPDTTTIRNDMYFRGDFHLTPDTTNVNLNNADFPLVMYATGTVKCNRLEALTIVYDSAETEFTNPVTFQSSVTVNSYGLFKSSVTISSHTAITGTLNTASINATGRIQTSSNVVVNALGRIFLDGGGDTFITESVANAVNITAGGTSVIDFGATNMNAYQDIRLTALKKLYLDGGGDTYIHEGSANLIQFNAGGSGALDLANNVAQFYGVVRPVSDNTVSCGEVDKRWTAVYAVNGTIQTSVSETKEDIKPLGAKTDSVIAGATYKRKVAIDDDGVKKEVLTPDILGFIADGLPEEAFAVEYNKETKTWERSTENVYTSAVIGILCERVNKLEAENKSLELIIQGLAQRITVLENKVK